MTIAEKILLGIAALVALNAIFLAAMLLWKRTERRPVRPVQREELLEINADWDWPTR